MTRRAAPNGRHESQEKAKILRSQNRKHSQSAKLQEDGEHRARATITGTVVVESQEPTNLNPQDDDDDDDVDDKREDKRRCNNNTRCITVKIGRRRRRTTNEPVSRDDVPVGTGGALVASSL